MEFSIFHIWYLATDYLHEIWNTLCITYDSFCSSFSTWSTEIYVYHIWKTGGQLPHMKSGILYILYISYEPLSSSYWNTCVPCLCFFLCTLNVCVCTLMCLCCLRFCVWVCFRNTADTHMKATEPETWSSWKRRHKSSTDEGRMVHASPQWPCPGQEWGKNGRWQLKTVGPLIWNDIRRHKQAHYFCCVVVCVCTRKQGWMVWGITQSQVGWGF